MKKIQQFIILSLLVISFSGCAVVGGIFKAGMGFGIFIILAILVVIVWAISKSRNK